MCQRATLRPSLIDDDELDYRDAMWRARQEEIKRISDALLDAADRRNQSLSVERARSMATTEVDRQEKALSAIRRSLPVAILFE